MELVLILGLIFASVGLLVWGLYPTGSRLVEAYQNKRAASDTLKLEDMFLVVSKQKMLIVYIISPLIMAVSAFVFTQRLMVAAVAAVLGLALPTLVIRIIEQQRNRKFSRQLVDALLVISSSLKGGLSFLQALEVLVEETTPPISQEFALVLRENKMGVSLDESLNRMNERVKSEELNLVVTAVEISRETGGNLTEPLEKLMITIREKDKIVGKIKTLTLQGKLQGIIMSVMPVIFGIVVYYLNPQFFTIMTVHPLGKPLLLAAGVLEIIGAFLLWQLSRVDV
ncbi:MAG: type II secretion system F family protein [Candidatus Omnitrophota bacterium]